MKTARLALLTALITGCSLSGGGTAPPRALSLAFDASRISIGVFTDRIATGDFNLDGKADLVVSSAIANTFSVLLGNGDGTFQAPVSFSGGPRTIHVSVADLNDDSKPDLVLAYQNADEISVRLGSGDGTFPPLVSYPVAGGPYWTAIADIDKDGRPDIAVATSVGVSVLRAKSGGIFWPATSAGSNFSPNSLTVADLNNDALLDLVTCNGGDATLSVLLGAGNGSFAPPIITPSAESTGQQEVVAADLNEDGMLDVITTNSQANSVNILSGNGDGTFRDLHDAAVGTAPYGIGLADFDKDGLLDIATANNGSNDISVLHGNGRGGFAGHQDFVAGQRPVYLVVGDWNGDHKPDLAVALASENAVGILLNTSH